MNADRSPLVPVQRLAEWLDSPRPPVLVDLRWYLGRPGDGRRAYLEGHLPGAIFLDLDDDLADLEGFGAPGRHPLPDPAAFVARVASVGIGDGTRVVGYDDVGGWVAARLWWMLDNLGFGRREVAGEFAGVLDGGIKAWLDSGRTLESSVPARPKAAARLSLHGPWHSVIGREALKGRLGTLTLLDARGAPRYRGETEPVDPVAGHIPTAINAPIDTNLAVDGRFLDAAELRSHYVSLGIEAASGSAGHEVVISCGSGTSACHHAVAMRAAGLPDPILYVGSYSDWSRSGEPVATGPDPGPPPI